MKALKIALLIFFLCFISFSAYVFFGPVQLKNPSYLYWVYFGKECPQDYFDNIIFADPAKSRIISGLSEEKIRERFPKIVDAEKFPSTSYRGQVLASFKNTEFKDQGLRMFWFDDDPQKMGWAIILVNGRGYRIDPIKG